MKQRIIIDAFCKSLTGKTANDYVERELGNKMTVEGLTDVRLIVGYDRIKRQLPDQFFPALVLEPIGGNKQLDGELIDGNLTLWLQLGTRSHGSKGSLVGTEENPGTIDVIDTLCEHIINNEFFDKSIQKLVSIRDLGETTTDGLFIGYRFYSLQVTYRVCSGIRGFV